MADFLNLLGSALGTTPPSYMEGLLGQQAVEDLQKRSIGTGLANALIGYMAMPKNQNLGLGRILAGAAQSGMQGAQGVYSGALEDYMTKQKVAEMQRKVDQQKQLESMISGLSPEEQVYARLAPEQWVANKVKSVKPMGGALSPQQTDALRQMGYNIPAGALVQQDENGKLSIVEGTAPKEGGTELDKLIAARKRLVDANPNDPMIKVYDSAIQKQSTFAPPMQAVTNVQNFVPAAQQVQRDAASALVKNYESLQYAPQTIATMEQAKQLVPNAVNFTGSFGEQKLQLAKFFNNNFGTSIDPTGVQNAEQLRSALFANVMDNLKKMDASPSQQQQAVMSKAFGTLDTDPSSLPKIIDIYENIIKNKVDIHNKRVEQIGSKVELPYDLKVSLPEPAPAAESLQQRIERIKRERRGGK